MQFGSKKLSGCRNEQPLFLGNFNARAGATNPKRNGKGPLTLAQTPGNYRLMEKDSTPVPVNPPPKRVISGPYAYRRNPKIWELKAIEAPELLKRLGREYAKYCKMAPVF